METAATERPVGSFKLLRYFSIASLIALVIAVLALAFSFREIAIKQVIQLGEESNVNLTRTFANSLKQHYIPLIRAAEKLGSGEIKASAEVSRLNQTVADAVRDTQVVKVRIFDPKGRTIYSSDTRQIGEDRSDNPGFVAARAGGIKTVLYQRESFDSFGKTLTDRDLLGSSIPVLRPGSSELDAVVEVYSDVTPFFKDIRRTQRNLRLATAAVIVLLYSVLFFIVKRADDVIKRQASQRELDAETIRHLAHHDPLTGLPNRKLFADRLTLTLARAKRNARMAALMFLDFDRFKEINDTRGHAVGDKVLQEAGKRLRGLLRDVDTVARFGGDEFTIILEDLADADHARTVAEKIRVAFSRPLLTEHGADIVVTPSTGIALYPRDGEEIDALLRAADAAMYDAKGAGRNAYRFHRPSPSLRAVS